MQIFVGGPRTSESLVSHAMQKWQAFEGEGGGRKGEGKIPPFAEYFEVIDCEVVCFQYVDRLLCKISFVFMERHKSKLCTLYKDSPFERLLRRQNKTVVLNYHKM